MKEICFENIWMLIIKMQSCKALLRFVLSFKKKKKKGWVICSSVKGFSLPNLHHMQVWRCAMSCDLTVFHNQHCPNMGIVSVFVKPSPVSERRYVEYHFPCFRNAAPRRCRELMNTDVSLLAESEKAGSLRWPRCRRSSNKGAWGLRRDRVGDCEKVPYQGFIKAGGLEGSHV